MKKKKHKRHNFYTIFSFMLFLFLLSGCEKEYSDHQTIQKPKEPIMELKPIHVDNGEFEKVAGWFDNHTILYITKNDQEFQVYKYNITSGKQSLFFNSKDSIKTVKIGPDRSKVLIQTAPLSNLARIYILDDEGKTIYTKDIESFDLTYNWNKENPQLLALTIFYEDWTYKVKVLQLNQLQMTEYVFDDPFVKWFGSNSLIMQTRNKEDSSAPSNLISYNLKQVYQPKTLKTNLYQFDTYKDLLMTVEVNPQAKEEAIYHFYNKSLKDKFSFRVPHLSQFNEWLVPFNDYLEKEKHFLSFIPYESGSIDQYDKDYKLISFDIENQKEKVLFKNLKNEPITCSPNEKLCLYGYQFENIIDLKGKRVIPLVKEIEEI